MNVAPEHESVFRGTQPENRPTVARVDIFRMTGPPLIILPTFLCKVTFSIDSPLPLITERS